MSLTTPTVTGYSGLFQTTGDRAAYAFLTGQARSVSANHIARFMKKDSNRDVIAALAALIGASAGGTATGTHKRIGNPAGPSNTVPTSMRLTDLGGNRTIDTITDINRATTSADVTELKKWFNNALLEAGITYPTVTGTNPAQGGLVNGVTRF